MRAPTKPPRLPKPPVWTRLRVAWRNPRFLPLWIAGGVFLLAAGALMWFAKPDPRIVKGLVVEPTDAMLRVGERQAFSARVDFTDGTSDLVTDSVQWILSNESFATETSSSGEVLARAEGVVTLRAEYGDFAAETSLAILARSTQRLECAEIRFDAGERKEFRDVVATVSGSFATDGKPQAGFYSLAEQIVSYTFVKRSPCAQEVVLRQTTPAGKILSESRVRLEGNQTDSKSLDVRHARLTRIWLRVKPLGECDRNIAYEMGEASDRFKIVACTE